MVLYRQTDGDRWIVSHLFFRRTRLHFWEKAALTELLLPLQYLENFLLVVHISGPRLVSSLDKTKRYKFVWTEDYKISVHEDESSPVLPGLYVGNYRDSKDASQLDRFEITHIVAIHDAARKLHSDKHYLCVMASDTPDQNLTQYFPLCNDFIHAARLRGGNVLIHCLAGMSRSVTVAVAYIMSVTSLNWKEALKVVRVGRAVANPNFGFQKQLQDFEMFKLAEERRRLKERYPSLALSSQDEEQCREMLSSYQSLIMTRELCEGDCAMGQTCPTGMCRSPSKRIFRRKSSARVATPPQSPRMLPPTPNITRSSSTTLNRRPRSGPAGLHSYTGTSAPPSRAGSRLDVSELPPGIMNWQERRGGSAPTTPMTTPPVSPQHWPRRLSAVRKPSST